MSAAMTTPAVALPAITSFAENPLTTTYTPSSDCPGIYRSGFLSVVHLSSSCFPSGFHTEPESYFSPGLICPSGYVSACHDNTGVATQTTVTCCPKGPNDITLSCVNPKSVSGVWSTLFCTWIAPDGDGTTLPITISDEGPTSTPKLAFTSPGGLNAFGVRMVYESSDLVKATATTATATTETSSATSGASTSSVPDDDSSSSSGLSTGAKAAIGVVIPLVVIALLAGLLLWRRKRQHRGAPVPQGEPEPKYRYAHEVPGTEVPERYELGAESISELPATDTRTWRSDAVR